MSTFELTKNLSAGVVCDYRNRPPPPPFPHGYPLPCEDNPLLLRCFPDPWLRDCNIAFNTPPMRTLKNVSLIDEYTHIVDDGDQSKRFKFQVENVTTATTREITIPDEDFTLITQTSSDTLTNKDITGLTNTVGATQFETSGAPVVITSTAPPGPGYALITTSAGVATWQDPTASGSLGKISYTLSNNKFAAVDTTYTPVSTFSWFQSRYMGYTGGIVIFHATIADRNLDVRLRNITTGTDLGSITGITGTGIQTFMITLPTANSTIQLEIRKNLPAGTSPVLEGASLEFDQ